MCINFSPFFVISNVRKKYIERKLVPSNLSHQSLNRYIAAVLKCILPITPRYYLISYSIPQFTLRTILISEHCRDSYPTRNVDLPALLVDAR